MILYDIVGVDVNLLVALSEISTTKVITHVPQELKRFVDGDIYIASDFETMNAWLDLHPNGRAYWYASAGVGRLYITPHAKRIRWFRTYPYLLRLLKAS